jgi:hydrogenase expression/formation protein HypD
MKFVDDYRKQEDAEKVSHAIRQIVKRPWKIMEICGGQTHTFVKYGMDQLLPPEIELVHGPGCPVCVTPLSFVDKAIAISNVDDIIFTSFGDMLRVPGSHSDLLKEKAKGNDIRIVYSPLDSLTLAISHPEKQIVLFGIGFETTAPTIAFTVATAAKLQITNFSVLISHVLVPPAIKALLAADGNKINGFIAPGHVVSITGTEAYQNLAETYRVPFVVTGFEPLDLLTGIYKTVKALEEKDYRCQNNYTRVVLEEGNKTAKHYVQDVFEVCDRTWRGLGNIPNSGYRLKNSYFRYNAEQKFNVASISSEESPVCIAGQILKGEKKPFECAAFAASCNPENPKGAPMVSSEGACSTYYNYKRV